MPARIRQLPPLVVAQIAAGEVIERPASVVKELLENAVDAGGTRLEVDVEQGGAELVRVVDDGGGIEADDLPLAFATHATSKLRGADDLFRVGTLGFRGEALASVGGVAQVTLQSRPPERPCGACVSCSGGELGPVRPWNGAPGTRVEVRHLFYNTPVRRKFLRASGTEMGHITEAVTRLALARAGLHLVLRHNHKLVHEVPAGATLLDRVGAFFGPEVRGQLYEVEAEAGHAALTGYVADPACERGTARMQYLFVNGRWVRDRGLLHAVQEAYRGLLLTGRYAVTFLFLRLPFDQVDVNVHPTKAEVRFRNAQAVHHLVYTAVKQRLRAANLVPRLQVPAATAATPSRPWTLSAPPPPAPDLPFTPPARRPEPPPAPFRGEPAKAIQLYDSYLVVEAEEGMLVIDQHALHERILFEQFRRRARAGTLETQALLIPEPVELTAEQAARALEHRDDLAGLGLGVEGFGGSTVLLTRYPALLGRRSPAAALKAVVDHLVQQDRPPAREALLHDLLSLMACHAAVRAGERLSPEEVAALLEQRALADDAHHCPHGRPTALLFRRHDLDRQFRRV